MSTVKRHLWSSKSIFILAAIGSAAGLGNLWKFPFLVYDNGGASFIIAYLIMLLLVWLGLLVWEVALGQKSRTWASESFWDISKNFKWVGWAMMIFVFFILTYYVVVIGWWMDYLFYSFKSMVSWWPLPWAGNGSDFFFNNILGITDNISDIGNISMPVAIWTIVGLLLTYGFTCRGAKSVGKVIWFTATIPFITLIIIALRAMTLPWARDGLWYLISTPTEKLWELSTWTAAWGQIFFTLSVAMWVMIAYGALKREKTEIVRATMLVAAGNTLISFLSAIAVFGTLGFLAQTNWVDVTEVVKWWPSLAFAVIPETLALFGNASAFFSVLFFLTIFLLAIDSAMSLIEGIAIPIKDQFPKFKTENITAGIIMCVGLVSLIYMQWNGLYILDIVDHYVTQFAMLMLGMIELVLFLKYRKPLTRFIEQNNDWRYTFFNTNYFVISWILWVIVLWILLFLNFKGWFFIYDTYAKADLMRYGFYPIIIWFWVAICINFLENLRK